MVIVKILTTLIIQMDYWNDVKNLILSPFKNPKLELIVVMLIIPFFVNVLLFWVTDNFLMRNKKSFLGHHQLRSTKKKRGHFSILEKVKVKYRTNANHRPLKTHESESDDLLSSEDDPIIQIHDNSAVPSATARIQLRNNSIQNIWQIQRDSDCLKSFKNPCDISRPIQEPVKFRFGGSYTIQLYSNLAVGLLRTDCLSCVLECIYRNLIIAISIWWKKRKIFISIFQRIKQFKQ